MDDLTLAINAAERGAALVRSYFGRTPEAELKRRNDPVTVADRESEEVILELIRMERPDDAIVAEESGGSARVGRRWLIDPLDGTVNFVHGIPHVSVAVGLYDGDVPLAAAIADPLRMEVFAAAAGEGATLNGSPMEVSRTDRLDQSVVVTGFPYDHHEHPDAYAAAVAAALAHVNGLRRLGSAALDLAWVAAGRFDAYWEYDLAPWDIAAGTLLVREAGGVVTDVGGHPAVPEGRHVVAGNPTLHGPLLAIVGEHLPPHLGRT